MQALFNAARNIYQGDISMLRKHGFPGGADTVRPLRGLFFRSFSHFSL